MTVTTTDPTRAATTTDPTSVDDQFPYPTLRTVWPSAATDLRVARPERGVRRSLDLVNSPPHYTSHPSGVECIRITEHLNFCLGNAVKYLWRADLKGGVNDLEKALWYVQREIQRRRALPQGGA